MLDPNIDSLWTLLAGLPVIVWLGVGVWRRTQALKTHIQEVRAEMARHPQDPYQALAALTAEQEASPQTGRQTGRRAGRAGRR